MKKIFLFLASIALLGSCEKPVEPVADFSYYVVRGGSDTVWNVSPIFAKEKVTFVNNGVGDYFVVYTGSSESEYDSRTLPADTLKKEQNVVGQKGVGYTLSRSRGVYSATYSYADKGEYNIVYVATVASNNGDDIITDVNDKVFITVRDTVAALYDVVLKKPEVSFSSTVYDGNTVTINVPYNTKQEDLVKASIKFTAGKASVYRGETKIEKGFAVYEDKGLDLSAGKTVSYRLVAPDGNEEIFTVQVKTFPKVNRTGNLLLSATVNGLVVTPAGDLISLEYPKGETTLPVLFKQSPGAKVLVDGTDYNGKALVSDFSDKGVITVVAEDGITNNYKYTVTEQQTVVFPFSFIGANGATGFLTSESTPGELSVFLSSTIDKKSLTPSFPVLSFTQISTVNASNELVPFKNATDVVDFTSPVKFVFQNGTDSLVYTITVNQ